MHLCKMTPTAHEVTPEEPVNRTRRCFFTLTEIVVTFGLAGIVIASAMALLSSSMWGENYLQRRIAATNIARFRLEALRMVAYDELEDMVENQVNLNDAGNVDHNGVFQRTTSVSSDHLNGREITVEVTCPWKYDQSGLVVSLTTIMMNDDVLLED